MKLTWKLATAYACRHPARMLLTSAAMIAAACVVVWVVSGYDAMVSRFGGAAEEYLGRYDLFVVPDATKEKEAFIPSEVTKSLRRDPGVAELEPVLQARVGVQTESGMSAGIRPPGMEGPRPPTARREPRPPGNRPPRPGRPRMGMFFGSPNIVGTSASQPPYQLTEGRWIRHDDPKLREAVLSNVLADGLKIKLGDEVLVISGTKEYRLKVIGIVRQADSQPLSEKPAPSASGRPMMAPRQGAAIGPAAAAVYVPMALAEKIAKRPGQVNLVNIKLKEGVGPAEFRSRMAAIVARAKPAVLLLDKADIRAAMEEGMMAGNTRRQAWAATGMSLLAALFIIFTTLSMGVHERVRQLAMMRAVGLTRGQVARVVAVEGLVLAMIGWGGGLLAGWGLLAVVSHARPNLFTAGPSLGWWCVLLTGLSALGGALVASIFPAWQATRVDPLEAMSPRRGARPSLRWAVLAGAVGLVLIAVNPVLLYAVPIANAARYGVHAAVGYGSMALGFLLLAPLGIIVIEWLLGPWIARLAGLEPRLLASQLSSNLWRTLGATAALGVGLGLYASMMVWGYSMLEPFRPGKWTPDVLAAFQMGGLPDAEVEAIQNLRGVVPGQCIPLAVEQPRLAKDITGSRQGNSVTRQDNVIMIGLDPEIAFGSNPLIRAKFVAGTAAEAVAKMKQGRYCIVPDHFLSATGLRVGDRFAVVPPERPDRPVEYTIAGAVELPGWHWMTKFSGLRRRSGRSAAMVFAPYNDVRRDFDIQQINFLWMNVERRIGVEKLGQSMQAIADRNLGERQPVNSQGTWAGVATMFGPSLRFTTPETIYDRITAMADDMIWVMCELPLITLLITSLGVVNTVMASVRARRWELGVLRAVGISRGVMFRMILAEGLLIGLVACGLSLAFGVLAGWCGTGISQYVYFFGGMATPLVVPWAKMSLGFGLALGLCLLAALWPAFLTARAEPLRLLQAGRADM